MIRNSQIENKGEPSVPCINRVYKLIMDKAALLIAENRMVENYLHLDAYI